MFVFVYNYNNKMCYTLGGCGCGFPLDILYIEILLLYALSQKCHQIHGT